MILRCSIGYGWGRAAITAILLIAAALLAGCYGQSYSCGPPGAPTTSTTGTCYGTVSWSGYSVTPTGLSMELTAVTLTGGDGWVHEKARLVDNSTPGGWVEVGELNEGSATDYFYAYTSSELGLWAVDLGPADGLNTNAWTKYEINQDSKTPSTWNITISRVSDGTVLATGKATDDPMTPDTVIEGLELDGHHNAQAPLAFFAHNQVIQGSKKTYQTSDGSIRSDNPPTAGWWDDLKPSTTTNGGQLQTNCC